MNEALQNLEIKVENGGTTPQGRLTSSEWNILVAAVKALDADSDDPSQLEAYLKPYAKTADVASTYATIASLSAVTSRLNDFLAGSDIDAIINKWSELETFLAGLTETDNLATILSGKANKATTLTGYGITDAYTKSHIDSNFVTIGTKQRITGEKDFVGGLKVNSGLVEYNATLKTWVFNGNLLVTGGMAAFSNISGFKPSTITDAVLIDDRTIKRNADGLLYAVDQGTGGLDIAQLDKYLTTNGYITSSGSITGNAASSNMLIEEVVTDLNNATPGRIFTMTSGYGSTHGNKPTTGWVTGLTLQYAQNGVYRRQLAYSDVDLYIREEHNGVWEKWRKILTSLNFYDYALPITGGTVSGDVTANIYYANKGFVLSNVGDEYSGLAAGSHISSVGNAQDIWLYNSSADIKVYTPTIFSVLGGNVALGDATASEKLHVYGNMLFEGEAALKSSLIGEVLYMSGSYLVIGGGSLAKGIPTYIDGQTVYVRAGNYVATFSDAGGLTWNGNILATGGITATNSSDERLKRNLRKFNASKVLMSLGGVYEYEYIDSEVQKNHIYEGTHYGLIYQHVKGTKLDVMCHEREDGMGALNYIHPKFISLIAGATMDNISEVEKLKRKIRHLENKVKQLGQRS